MQLVNNILNIKIIKINIYFYNLFYRREFGKLCTVNNIIKISPLEIKFLMEVIGLIL